MFWHRADCRREVNDMPGAGGLLLQGDALALPLEAYAGQVQCLYLDPPFFTGENFTHRMRVGSQGWEDGKQTLELAAYDDFSALSSQEYHLFLQRLIERAHGLLHARGSLFLHLDYRMSTQARLLCDAAFGADQFRNEIVWSYQTGGRSKKYFSRKHDTILFYAKGRDHFFDITQVPAQKKKNRDNHLKREVDEHGRAYRTILSNGKRYIYYDDEPAYPDDVWTDVSQMQQKDPQRTGYPTQKPQALLDRIILCCTRADDLVADLVCGSGTALVSAAQHGRRFLGVDNSSQAFSVCRKRLAHTKMECVAPLAQADAMVDAAVTPGIGFYSVALHAYTLAQGPNASQALMLQGLDSVDQWYAGLLAGGVFTAYASSCRRKQTPELARTLQVPVLRGTVALMIIDVFGNRTLWSASGVLE